MSKLNVKNFETIGTHNGVFHSDEVAAIALLNVVRQALDLSRVSVIRTRDTELLSKCDITVDVGGGQFDHHTGENAENYTSSLQLVYEYFKEELCDIFGVTPYALEKAEVDALVRTITEADNGKHLPDFTVDKVVRYFNAAPGQSDEQFSRAVAVMELVLVELLRNAQEVAKQESIWTSRVEHGNGVVQLEGFVPEVAKREGINVVITNEPWAHQYSVQARPEVNLKEIVPVELCSFQHSAGFLVKVPHTGDIEKVIDILKNVSFE